MTAHRIRNLQYTETIETHYLTSESTFVNVLSKSHASYSLRGIEIIIPR